MEVTVATPTAAAVLNTSKDPQDMGMGKKEAARLKFTTEETELKIVEITTRATHPKDGGVRCHVCQFVATCASQLRVHTRQHYTNHIHECGESSYRRDWVLEHIRKECTGEQFGSKGCRPGLIYEVDRPSFSRFARETQNPAKEFQCGRRDPM